MRGEQFFSHAFGDNPRRMTMEEQAYADFDRRLESVWPFVFSRAASFVKTLRPRERANMDLSDILCESVIELIEKDSKFDPRRSKYITFVGTLLKNLFSDMRDKANTVHAPRDSRNGTNSVRGRPDTLSEITRQKIRATKSEYAEVTPESAISLSSDPMSVATKREDEDTAVERVLILLQDASPYEAVVIGARFGLWGNEPKTFAEIASRLRKSGQECRSIAMKAMARWSKKAIESGWDND
jgi:hypothetical protein